MILSGLWGVGGASAEETRTLVVSAYYSPLEGQVGYVTGSYTGDVRLNGNGTNGADGTEVYAGMLAAPSTYSFGTQIFIPGLGTGTVHDRGGAIKAYEDYDRIDVWMGFGDEGRIRALQWGKQTVEGVIYADGGGLKDEIYFAEVEVPAVVVQVEEKHDFMAGLSSGSEGNEVEVLQEALASLGLLASADVTGVYDDVTEEAVYQLQLQGGVLSSRNDYGAGYFGNQTRSALEALLDGEEVSVVVTSEDEEEDGDEKETVLRLEEGVSEEEDYVFENNLQQGDAGSEVSRLQDFLVDEGLFEGEVGGYYGQLTKKAVMEFQLQEGIINDATEENAGVFDEETRECVNNMIYMQEGLGVSILAGVGEEKVPLSALVARLDDGSLALGDSGEAVSQLQELLVKLEYLDIEPTGYFGEQTEEALTAFQVDYGVVESASAVGAGVFGPKTRGVIAELIIA